MTIYFIRHDESETNEQNQFAGLQDSLLTYLARAQARQSGRAIARESLIFDEIHVSPLQSARLTAQKIAEISGNAAATVHVSDALLERHFGFPQGHHKSLWKKILRYQRHNEQLHSSRGAPQHGQTWYEMYYLVRDYYEQVLQPASQKDKTILVVAHKQIVEMFTLIVANLPLDDDYNFKIPNSRPLSESELRHLATHAPQSANTQRELVKIHLPLLLFQWLVRCVRESILPVLTRKNTIPDQPGSSGVHNPKQDVYESEDTPNSPESSPSNRWADIDRYLLRLPDKHKQNAYASEAMPNSLESFLKVS